MGITSDLSYCSICICPILLVKVDFLILDDSINEINYKTSSTSHNLEENGSVTSISSDVLLEVNSGSQQEVSTSKEIVAQKHTNNSPSSVVNETEDFNEKSETSRIVTNSLISTESNEVQNEYDSRNKSDYERNEVPSISNTSHSSLYNLHTPEQDISVHEDINNLNTSTKTSPKTGSISIKKRVTEIMAEANQFSKCGDRSPRFQEIYTTTYDLTSPISSPELGKLNFDSPQLFHSSEAKKRNNNRNLYNFIIVLFAQPV